MDMEIMGRVSCGFKHLLDYRHCSVGAKERTNLPTDYEFFFEQFLSNDDEEN